MAMKTGSALVAKPPVFLKLRALIPCDGIQPAHPTRLALRAVDPRLAFFRCGDIPDDAGGGERSDLLVAEAEQIAEDLVVVLAKRRRQMFDFIRPCVVALAIGH